MEMEDFLKSLMKERLGLGGDEDVFKDMKARTNFAYEIVEAFVKRGRLHFPDWLYKNEGEVAVVQLLLPEGMAEALKSLGDKHKEHCESCSKLEECKSAGIYDDPVRVTMTEIFKVGFSTIAEHALKDRF